jgi:hypothetical protein
MGLLEAPKSAAAPQLRAGDSVPHHKETPGVQETLSASGLTAEDLKELADLDLSEFDTKESKSPAAK